MSKKKIAEIIIGGVVYDVIKQGGRDFVKGLNKFVDDVHERYEVRYEKELEDIVEVERDPERRERQREEREREEREERHERHESEPDKDGNVRNNQ